MTDVPIGSHSGGAGRHVDCARPLANGHGVHLNGGVRHRRSDPCLQMRVVPKRGLASAAQGRSLGADDFVSLLATSQPVPNLYVVYLPLFAPIPPLLALLFDKQESQERRFKIHTAKTMNGSDHAGTKGNAAPMPRWVATAAPPVRPVFAPAAAAPRRPRPFAPARQRVARLARRSVPPVALSRPASSKDGARVRSAFAQPRALFVPFNGRVAPEERGTICG